MNANRQIANAVENIQEELTRISTVAGLLDLKLGARTDSYLEKITLEFNTKLRDFRSKNRDLREENEALKSKIQRLEVQMAAQEGPNDLAFKPDMSMAPPRKTREEKIVILSSPIKAGQEEFVGANTHREFPFSDKHLLPGKQFLMDKEPPKCEVSSSQFNGLPTQYSDSSSQFNGPVALDKRDSRGVIDDFSPPKKIKRGEINSTGRFVHGNDNMGMVADSQDEFEPLGEAPQGNENENIPKNPPHYTALQRVEFLRVYYQSKQKDPKYKVDLRKNPISEKPWALDDFVPNPEWKPCTKLNANLGTMTKRQEVSYREFFNEAGLGRKMGGPKWDSDDQNQEEQMSWDRSQVMDKYSSPPGFMTGDFADTQEIEEQKRQAKIKQQDRIKRRFASVLAHGEFIFYEETLNFFVREKRYVNAQPVFKRT